MLLTLEINIHMFTGSNPLVVFAKASMLRNCKIQTLCVKTNIRVSFTPPEVMDEDCVKILYYHHQNFTMCQRVVDIRLNEGNDDSSKQLEPDFSEVFAATLPRDYYLVYGYDYSHCIYEVDEFKGLSLLQKFERFFEKIPHDASVAFINPWNSPWVPHFVKALLRHLGRKPPIDAKNDPDIVQTWLNEPRRDLIAHSSTLNNMKTKFIINLDYYSYEQLSAARNATSQYTFIFLSIPSQDERKAMTFLSSEKNKQSDEAYPIHKNNLENYLSRTDRYRESSISYFRVSINTDFQLVPFSKN